MAREIAIEYSYLVVALVESKPYTRGAVGWRDQSIWPYKDEQSAQEAAEGFVSAWADRALIFKADLDDDGHKVWMMHDEKAK